MIEPRKGQVPAVLKRGEFHLEFQRSFFDPSFKAVQTEIAKVEQVAWENYINGNKSPITAKAGPDFAEPDYDLSVEWKSTRDKLIAAEATQKDSSTKSRVLLVCGSARNDGSCPGEISKTYRMTKLAVEILEAGGIEVDQLDLSLLISDYDKHIYPCKACVSTAMPLCHWPCSCYPNHGQRQTNDWMAEIYERWVLAHAVVIVTPVHWYQSPSPLKLMIDRLVCADGGNPDPTSTQGKDPAKAKALEMKGWDYPKHLDKRAYGLVVHGDVAGIEGSRRALSDWLDWIGLIDAGVQARLDRFIGYYEPYATSHDVLDGDKAVQEETRNVGRAVACVTQALRRGELASELADLPKPRPK